MALTVLERLKDLRVECGLTLEQLAEQTNLSKSALGSYEADSFKDISHYALIKLTKFYSVTTDYLLGLSEMKQDLEEGASFKGSRLEQWLLIYCKQNHLPYNQLMEEVMFRVKVVCVIFFPVKP